MFLVFFCLKVVEYSKMVEFHLKINDSGIRRRIVAAYGYTSTLLCPGVQQHGQLCEAGRVHEHPSGVEHTPGPEGQ